jgi:hypothetical protein
MLTFFSGCDDMETCQIREQRTPQKRRGAISAEVYTDEEVKILLQGLAFK